MYIQYVLFMICNSRMHLKTLLHGGRQRNAQNVKINANLPLDGPTLALSYDELAVIALSAIAPLCIPRLLRQLAVTA